MQQTGSQGARARQRVLFFFSRFVQFIKKRLNKSPTRHRGRNYASNYEQKLRSTPQHTQHTPILKTPHTTRHPHSIQTYYRPPGSKHYRDNVHTACKQANCSKSSSRAREATSILGHNMPVTTAKAFYNSSSSEVCTHGKAAKSFP